MTILYDKIIDVTKNRMERYFEVIERKEDCNYICDRLFVTYSTYFYPKIPFYGHFKENSLLVSFDGASSLGNYSAFLYRNGRISLIENNWNDLGFASKFFNDNKLAFCTLNAAPYEHCSVPGKLPAKTSIADLCPKLSARDLYTMPSYALLSEESLARKELYRGSSIFQT